MKARLLLIVLTCLQINANANYEANACDAILTLPQDITICEPANVNLNGSIIGDYISYEWTSSTGYSNSSNLNPAVFTNTNTTYTLTAYSIIGGNIIINGDFELGDQDFTTDYTLGTMSCYNAGYLDCEGTYGVIDDPSLGHNNFASCGDHTSGNGNMMVVNGAQDLQNIWCQEISVTAGTSYVFSAWAASVNSSSPAILQFSIDGLLLGENFFLTSALCQWEEFNEVWTATASGTITLCVTNQNTATGGNDFAIDDIFFGEVCEEDDSFEVTLVEFEIDADVSDLLTCELQEVSIEVNVEPNGNYMFDWSTADGNITSNSTGHIILVDQAGTYTIIVSDDNGCSETLTIMVDERLDLPVINIIGEFELDCDNPTVEFEAIVGATDPEIFWYNDDNELVGTDFILSTNTAGIYTAIVTDLENGCISSLTWEVVNSSSSPLTTLFTDLELGCLNDSIFIFSESSEEVSIYQWTLSDGTVVSSADLDSILIDSVGIYSLEAFHPNGCISQADIIVEASYSTVDADIILPIINCTQDSFQLFLENSDAVVNIEWTSTDGYFSDSDTAYVVDANVYFLEMLDTLGCVSLDTIELQSDLAPPLVELQDAVLTCQLNSVDLEPVFVSDVVSAVWTNAMGVVIPGDSISVSTVGEYTLNVVGENACTNVYTSQVTADLNFPSTDLSASIIDCNNPIANIDAVVTSMSDYNVQWLFDDVVISDLESIEVSVPGVYYLEVRTDANCNTLDSIIVGSDFDIPIYSLEQSGNVLDCVNNEIELSLNNIDPNYTVNWILPDNTTSSSQQILVTESGTYVFEIIGANGCTNTGTVEILEDFEPPLFDVSSLTITCLQSNTQLFLNSTQDLDYFINGEEFLDIENTFFEQGTFSLLAIGENGCETTIQYTIPVDTIPPTVSIDGNAIDCIETTSSLFVESATDVESYLWNDPDGDIVSNSDEIIVMEPGVYSLVVTASNACTAASSYEVLVDQELPVYTIDIEEFSCTNATASISINANEEYIYNWIDFQEDGATLYINEAGSYSMELTNPENGCSVTESINVENSIVPFENIVFSTTNFCADDFATLSIDAINGGTPGYEIYINDKIASLTEEIPAGESLIQIVDAAGCTMDTIVNAELIAALEVSDFTDISVLWQSEQFLNLTTNRTEDEIVSVQWSPDSLFSCPNCLEQTIRVEENLSIEVVIEDIYGCIEIRQINITTEFNPDIYIPNVFSPNNDGSNDNFTIFGSAAQVEKVLLLEIFDRWGNRVFTNEDFDINSTEEGWNGSLKTKPAVSGVYVFYTIVKFKNGEQHTFNGDLTLLR